LSSWRMRRRLQLATEDIPPVVERVRDVPASFGTVLVDSPLWLGAHTCRHHRHRASGVGAHRALERCLRDRHHRLHARDWSGSGRCTCALVERGAESPVAFSVGPDARLLRGEEPVPLEALRAGDTVRLTIDGRSGSVLRLHAAPVSGPAFMSSARVPGSAALLAALGLIGGATALAIRNSERLPALSARVTAARLLPAAAAR
jgi:hypothetical protein